MIFFSSFAGYYIMSDNHQLWSGEYTEYASLRYLCRTAATKETFKDAADLLM